MDRNATQAAIRCGYSPKTAKAQGSRLLTAVDIAQQIAAAQEKVQESTLVTVGWVVEKLRSVAERCMEAEQVTVKGQPVPGAYTFDSSGANRALELLGKTFGAFVVKHEHTGKDGAPLHPLPTTITVEIVNPT